MNYVKERSVVVKKIFLKILFGIDVAVIVIYSVCATMLVRTDSATGIMTDGFGRVITEPPFLFRWYLCIGEWVGLGWFIIDTIVFWGLVAVAWLLFNAISEKK